MWALNEALALIRRIQPLVRPFNYHLAIGGGVLNKGYSTKDLDLYCIPFSERGPDSDGLRAFFVTEFGPEFTLGGPNVDPVDTDKAYEPEPMWVNGRYTYWLDGSHRIDIFIA